MPLNLIFIQPGTYTIDDNGIPGDNISVIRDGTGTVIFTFAHPADALGFTVSTPGVNIVVNLTDSLNAANLTIGSTDPDPLIGPPQSPDSIVMKNVVTTGTVTLVSNGAITEGGADAASDITAGALIMSAVSGVGTASNAIETRTGLFEAETTTGGVNIRNIGSVQIGGLTADVDGLDVVTSGNINFTTIGSIFLTEANSVTAAEVVHGGATSGNVTLVASGANADIIGNVDNGAVTVPRGTLALTAGRDIQLGTIGADFNNDVVTNNTLTFNAGRDILIDGFADILADNFGLDTGGDVIFNAGRNIGILNVAGTSASVTASGSGGGNALITAGGSLTVNGPGSFALGSTSGDVIVSADRVLIDAGSGISAPSGQVTIRPTTEGREMILGSAGDAALAVELSDVELNRIFATSLTLGSAEAGRVRVIAPIAPISAGNAPDLIIRGSDILVESNITTIDALTLRGGNNVFQTGASVITVGNVTPGIFTALIDDDADDGGIDSLLGTIAASSVRINGNVNADTLEGTDGDDIMTGGGGADTLRGKGGADNIDGGTGADSMAGGLGDDDYIVDNTGDVIVEAVGEGNDTVTSSATHGLDANVEELTLTGSADINGTGNSIDNILNGNSGDNTLSGLGGEDTLLGNAGDDRLLGGTGNDFMIGGAGDDTLNGGTQTDTVSYAGATGAVTVALISGAQATGGAGSDTISAVENLTGSNHGDTLTGNSGANVLTGASGNDVLSGLGGNDTLFGDLGGDTLVGGTGRDIMTGGASGDTFDFNAVAETGTSGGTRDQIEDFVHGSDEIDLATIDANTTAAGNQAFAFIGAAAFSGVAGQLRAVQSAVDTVISGDINGDSVADFQIQLNTVVTLTAGDFVL